MNRFLLVASSLLIGLGCAPQVGDECATNADCGSGLICDSSQPGGYCTASPCTPNSCPEESVCIEFPDKSKYCMLRCDGGSDCRDDYTCETNYGDLPFCSASPYVPPATTSPSPANASK